jgi:hypothetical protein
MGEGRLGTGRLRVEVKRARFDGKPGRFSTRTAAGILPVRLCGGWGHGLGRSSEEGPPFLFCVGSDKLGLLQGVLFNAFDTYQF